MAWALFYAFLGTLLLGNIGADANTWTAAQWDNFIGTSNFLIFADWFNTIFFIILGVLAALFLIYYFVLAPLLQKKGASQAQQETTKETAKPVEKTESSE